MKCGAVQKQLMDYAVEKKSGTLPPHLQTHVESCTKCQQEWKNLQGWVSFLRSDDPWSPDNHFFDNLVERAVQEKRRGDLTEPAYRQIGKWNLFDWENWNALTLTHALSWAAVACILISVLGFGWNQWQEIGTVEYGSGNVIANNLFLQESVDTKTIDRNTYIQVPQRANCILRLEGGAQVMIASLSRVIIHDSRSVEIQKGKAYFDIPSGRGDFQVQVPEGTVQVLGTAFEISVDNEGSEVTVTRGLVQLSNGLQQKMVNPGQVGIFTFDQNINIQQAQSMNEVLQWIKNLQDEKNQSDLRKYYPSLAVPEN